MLTVADLNDPTKFVRVPDVPLLDEHVLRDGTGHVEVKVDAAMLGEVAANNNRKWTATGEGAALIVGHTADGDGAAEKPVVGWAVNFRVAPFTNGAGQTVAALFADLYYRADKAHLINDFPRRSVELWVKKREIDPIALLGGTTPERDLGVVRFSKLTSDFCYHYSAESATVPTDPKKMESGCDDKEKYAAGDKADAPNPESKSFVELQASVAKIESMLGKIMPVFEQIMQEEGQQPAGDADQMAGDDDDTQAGDEQPDDADADDVSDQYEDDDLLAPHGGDSEKDARGMHEPAPVKFEGMGYGMGSATNTFTPGMTKMSRQSTDPRVVKLERQVAALIEKNAELEAVKDVAALKAKDIVIKDEKKVAERLKYARLAGDDVLADFVADIEENWPRKAAEVPTPAAFDVAKYARVPDAGGHVTQPADGLDPHEQSRIINEAYFEHRTNGTKIDDAFASAKAKYGRKPA